VWHAVQPVPLLLSAAITANISDEEIVQMRGDSAHMQRSCVPRRFTTGRSARSVVIGLKKQTGSELRWFSNGVEVSIIEVLCCCDESNKYEVSWEWSGCTA
jgi:hypothetical protein